MYTEAKSVFLWVSKNPETGEIEPVSIKGDRLLLSPYRKAVMAMYPIILRALIRFPSYLESDFYLAKACLRGTELDAHSIILIGNLMSLRGDCERAAKELGTKST